MSEPRSYYGRPILKKPVWKWYIGAYFFAGGVAGASSLVTLGARLTKRPVLARRARLTSLVGLLASTWFLVADLGRPERFAHMLRVAKPTSPMSVGSWLLAGFGPAVGVGAAADLLGILPGIGAAADVGAAVLGPAVATYTSVLVSDTAIPAWHDAHRELPFVFAAGSASSAAGLLAVLTPAAEAGPVRRLAVASSVAKLVATERMDKGLGSAGAVYKTGPAGTLHELSRYATGAGAALMLLAGRRRMGAVVAGTLLATAGALQRFSVMEAGRQSAEDPAYTVGPQRERLDERAATAARLADAT